MIGIFPRILVLIAGCVAGYWFFDTETSEALVPIRGEPPAAASISSVDHSPDLATSESNCEPGSAESGVRQSLPAQSAVPSEPLPVSELAVTGLPLKYHRLVEPESREPQTFSEWFLAFVDEPRNDAWANVTEPRIRAAMSAAGEQGIHADYIACKSSRCTVAGYSMASSDFDSCLITGWIGKARIFNATFGSTCMEQEIGGLTRFVVLLDSEIPE